MHKLKAVVLLRNTGCCNFVYDLSKMCFTVYITLTKLGELGLE